MKYLVIAAIAFKKIIDFGNKKYMVSIATYATIISLIFAWYVYYVTVIPVIDEQRLLNNIESLNGDLKEARQEVYQLDLDKENLLVEKESLNKNNTELEKQGEKLKGDIAEIETLNEEMYEDLVIAHSDVIMGKILNNLIQDDIFFDKKITNTKEYVLSELKKEEESYATTEHGRKAIALLKQFVEEQIHESSSWKDVWDYRVEIFTKLKLS